MLFTLPEDFGFAEGIAITLLFGSWFAYSATLKRIAHGSLNEQLSAVRVQWLRNSTRRLQKPYDAILLGHIVNSIAFFGSATMIVLAGVITLLANVQSIHGTVSDLEIARTSSLDLFVIHVGVLNVILALSFFSFTYALRKLLYVIALVGALPEERAGEAGEEVKDSMVTAAATVLSEALKTFNFGIRGYYYSVASLGLFISPFACMALTLIATGTLFYRQISTATASAIRSYVSAAGVDDQD